MTDTPTPADGWYPDPAGSGGLRRWNGVAWTDDVRPSATEAPFDPPVGAARPAEPVAPSVPAPPVAPSVPASPVAPAYPGSSVPASPGVGTPASPASAAPAYPGITAADPTIGPDRAAVRTNTVWIWLVVALTVVWLLPLVLFDWATYYRESFYVAMYPEQAPDADWVSLAVSAAGFSFNLVMYALTVLFSFLDWRQLRARGVPKPFHWAWSFFVLLIFSGGVYVIGRTVVLRRVTGRGFAPLWAWIAATIVTIVGFSIWVAVVVTALAPLLGQVAYFSEY